MSISDLMEQCFPNFSLSQTFCMIFATSVNCLCFYLFRIFLKSTQIKSTSTICETVDLYMGYLSFLICNKVNT